MATPSWSATSTRSTATCVDARRIWITRPCASATSAPRCAPAPCGPSSEPFGCSAWSAHAAACSGRSSFARPAARPPTSTGPWSRRSKGSTSCGSPKTWSFPASRAPSPRSTPNEALVVAATLSARPLEAQVQAGASPGPLRLDPTVGLELAVQRGRADPELRGGVRLVAAVHLEGREDVLLLDVDERPYGPSGGHGTRERLADLFGEVVELDATPLGERDGALHGVLELAH